MGAFAAHALKPLLLRNGTWDVWQTAVFYQFVHALAMLAMGQGTTLRKPTLFCWCLGTVMFSGSLYFLALFPSQHWAGPATPVGGMLLIVGWGCLLWDLRHRKQKS